MSLFRETRGTASVSRLRTVASCCHSSVGVEVTNTLGQASLCTVGARSGAGC